MAMSTMTGLLSESAASLCKTRVATIGRPRRSDPKPRARFFNRCRLQAIDRSDAERRANHVAVVARRAAIGKMDAVFEPDAHEVATQRESESRNLEHVAPRRGNTPNRSRKKSQALIDRKQDVARNRRCRTESAAVQQPDIVAMAIEESFIGVPQEPMERARLDDFVLERRIHLVDSFDVLLEQRRRVHVRRLFGIATLGVVEIGRTSGNPKQVLPRLEIEKAESLAV